MCSIGVLACVALWAPSHGQHVKAHKHHKHLAHHVIATPTTKAPVTAGAPGTSTEECSPSEKWICDIESTPEAPAAPEVELPLPAHETPLEQQELAEAEQENVVSEEW